MKKSIMMKVGILIVMLSLGGFAYAQSSSGQAQGTGQSAQESGQSATSGSATDMSQRITKLSVNTATIQELERVPGLDRTTAQNIVDYRLANGPFSSIDDISKVQGIDKQKMEPLKQHLTAKLDLNVATAEQLQRVPGIQQRLAQNIIQYREANGPFSSVNDLSRIQGIDRFKIDMIRKYVEVGGKES